MSVAVESTILLMAILLIVGVFTAKFSSRLGLPALVLFIVLGMLLNRYIYFDNAILTQFIGTLALIIILFEGGMKTNAQHVKKVYKPALSLATLGVLTTAAVIGTAAKYILNVSWLEGFLFGAIVGSTDAAAVFAVLGNKNIKTKLTATLEAESGTNDPMAIFLTVSVLEIIQLPDTSIFSLILNFIWEMAAGLILGYLLGKISVWVINKISLDSSGLYPVLSIALAVLTFGATTLFHASGFLSVYIMALIVGNSDLTYRHSILRFNEGFAWMSQIIMFILMGLLVFPNQLTHIFWQGIVLSLLLILAARPIGVTISLLLAKYNFNEQIFISWAGLKGAVPIVIATYPLVAGIENGVLLFNVVFFVVLSSALIQGATISPLASALNLSGKEKTEVPHSLELISIGKTNHEMIEVQILEDALIAGREIKNITLPDHTLITAVVRKDRLITPVGDTKLEPKDTLYVLVKKSLREEVKQAIQRRDKENKQLGGENDEKSKWYKKS
ncbi:potassium/proton antiporter [Falsibacillus albus]|uniref:Potassium/proton antiporter n=1 Tax=Falsibacillus albus TaxID=2478915 RepID=A0A3L7JTC6_9BACI|nr:potassium/proton antiporter [Falsibacillus albus]RLQ93309.1 potassium/proton antiporter [Falsibacillus albus]